MAEPLIPPIPIRYTGLWADAHLVDAQQFGHSVAGAAQLANSVADFFFFGDIRPPIKQKMVRFYVRPSKENGLLQEMVAVLASGQIPVFSPIFFETANKIIEALMDAVIKRTLRREVDAAKAVNTVADIAAQFPEFASQVHHGHMQEKAWLHELVGHLLGMNRGAVRTISEPVGKSVRRMEIGQETRILIDEPDAAALQSKDELIVGDAANYAVKIQGVFRTDGACRVELPGG